MDSQSSPEQDLAELRAAVLDLLARIRATEAELLKRIVQTQTGEDGATPPPSPPSTPPPS